MCIVAIILQQVSRFGLPTMIWSSEKVQRWILDHGDHEESDTRMMVHLTQAMQNGCKKVVLSTVDTDAVVISIYTFSVLHVKSIQTYSFGSSLDHPRNNRYTILVKYLKTWESKNARHYHSSLRSLDVMQHHNLSTKENYLHGMLGWHIRKQQMHS